MNATLTDRYVDAATRSVPEKQREEIAAELRERIADQLDARLEAGEARDAAERDVLTELGDPDRLAAGYTDRPLYVIGPKYYLDWWRLLKLLLWIVLPSTAFAVALAQVLAGATIGPAIGAVVVTLLTVAVHLFFWVTIVFIIVERTGTPVGKAWAPDQLPEVRARGIGFGDMIASLVFLVIGAGAIGWDQLIGFVPGHPGLSFLDEGLWPWWIGLLFLIMAIEAGLAIVVYLVGRWTIPLAILNTVLALAVAVPALVLLAQGDLLNREFWTTIIPAGAPDDVATVVAVAFGFGIALIAVWDIVDVWIKTVRPRR